MGTAFIISACGGSRADFLFRKTSYLIVKGDDTMALKNAYLIDLMQRVEARNANDKQFLITVRSVLESIEPVVEKHPEYVKAGVLELFVEQERVIKFRVPWIDDAGNVRVNRGYRVQGNSAIGPYVPGL